MPVDAVGELAVCHVPDRQHAIIRIDERAATVGLVDADR